MAKRFSNLIFLFVQILFQFNCKREPEGSPRRSKRLAGEKPELTIDLTSKRTLEYTIKKTRAANANLQQTEATKDTQSEATQSFASPHSSSDSCLESTTNETGQEVMLFGVVIGFSSNKKLPHGVSEVMQTERALMVISAFSLKLFTLFSYLLVGVPCLNLVTLRSLYLQSTIS